MVSIAACSGSQLVFMSNVIMLNVVMLSVAAPIKTSPVSYSIFIFFGKNKQAKQTVFDLGPIL